MTLQSLGQQPALTATTAGRRRGGGPGGRGGCAKFGVGAWGGGGGWLTCMHRTSNDITSVRTNLTIALALIEAVLFLYEYGEGPWSQGRRYVHT